MVQTTITERINMELTKTKLHNILKKYKAKRDDLDKEWKELCKKKCKTENVDNKVIFTTPTLLDHEQYNAKGNKLFHDLIEEFDGYDIFPKKKGTL
ncbi:MAG: hypothetical protein WC254_07355 [Candidatus Woesearchaeota archaeon]|jgi:hypothetical protein